MRSISVLIRSAVTSVNLTTRTYIANDLLTSRADRNPAVRRVLLACSVLAPLGLAASAPLGR
jgi:hypothetical protein